MPQITELPTAVRDPQTYAIIGAAMEVHRRLGPGFLEPVYQDCFTVELELRGIPATREVQFPIHYKGIRIASAYRVDFLCFGQVIVELKALRALTRNDDSQVINYLVASGLERAVLLNFGSPSIEFKRFISQSA